MHRGSLPGRRVPPAAALVLHWASRSWAGPTTLKRQAGPKSRRPVPWTRQVRSPCALVALGAALAALGSEGGPDWSRLECPDARPARMPTSWSQHQVPGQGARYRAPCAVALSPWRSHHYRIAEGAALLKGICGGAIEFRGSLSAADGAMHLGGLISSATSGATCVGAGSHLLPVRLRSPGRALLHCQTRCATPDRQSGAAVAARRLARRPPGSDGGLEGLGGLDKGRSACSDGLVGRRADDRTVGGNDADCWRRVLDPEK